MQINFDNIHSTQISETIANELQFDKFSGDYKSEHFVGRNTKTAIENSRTVIAESIGAFPGEIIFTQDYLQSYLLIFKLVTFLKIDTFITSETENKLFLRVLKSFATENEIKLIFVDYSNYASLDLKSLENVLKTTSNSVVFLSHVNLYSGHLIPAKKISKLCSKYKSIFAIDISNSITNFRIDIESIKADIAIFSPNKFHGFSGIQGFYLKSRIINDADFLTLFHVTKREFSTPSTILIKSFELAVLEVNNFRNITSKHLELLKKHFTSNLQELDLDIEILFHSSEKTLNNLLILNLPYSDFWIQLFDMKGIAVFILPSQEKRFHDIKGRSLLVVSFSKFNTVAEIDYFISSLTGSLNPN